MISGTRIVVAALGDVLDVNTWSNIPYYFYNAGHEAGFFSDALRIDLNQFKTKRIVWNLKQVALGRGPGGYQYSPEFIDACEKQIPPDLLSSVMISFNQVFPRAESVRKAGGKIYYYIDSTLNELFNAEVYNIRIPDKMKALAIGQETENYRKAEGVVTMSRWIHPSLVDFYKVDPRKVSQVLPGANINIPSDFHPRETNDQPGIQSDFVLGFVGKDWKRKGLPVVLAVGDKLRERGIKCRVKVIGPIPTDLEGGRGIDHTGFIDKQSDTRKFIEEVSSCDLGCLFSSSEALGISTLEFLRLGVPVTGFFHQGLIDTLVEGASIRFEPFTEADHIADTLHAVIRDTGRMRLLKQAAIDVSNTVTWEACVTKWASILS